ncbi:MAG: hypothetical protein FJ006_02890 [Chloroflexi bacterium]|nr:hypothetical protein [Chloroflexota bacterium]
MSDSVNSLAIAGHAYDTSHIARDTRQGYASFVNLLPMYFAGKYWCFYLSDDKVREPRRIDPLKESVSFFFATPEIASVHIGEDVFLSSFRKFVSSLAIKWYDFEGEIITNSSVNYLPLTDNMFSILFERNSFAHSLIDIEPSRDEIINLAMARVAEAYSKVEDVSAIYVYRYLDDTNFVILLENTKYSRSLMDRLLQLEYDLLKQNPLLTMHFFYMPKLYEGRTDVIHPGAELIYDRDTNAILSGSFVSSTT